MQTSNDFNFMSELQKKILDQIVKGGLAVLLLFLFAWYQTNRIEAQEVKFEAKQKEQDAKISTLQDGLFDCNTERATLKAQLDNLQKFIYSKTKNR